MKNLIYPCLWFDGNAKEAATFYSTVFDKFKITEDTGMVILAEADGRKFMFLNGGPDFKINPSVSFFVQFDEEKQVEEAWNKLIQGGKELMPLDTYDWSKKYGWVQDKYGVSWQLSVLPYEEICQKFTPALMFTKEHNGKAAEAVQFYTSLFEYSSVKGILRYGPEDGDIEGNVKHAQFSLSGYVLMAMESSLQHDFTFNEAVSFVVECDTQQEIDYYWNSLTAGGEESMCGWLKDRFGVSWQIVPAILPDLMDTPEKARKVSEVFLKMRKLDIEKLVAAAEHEVLKEMG